jgi:Protein of unknown function (DUF3485)
VTETEGTRRSGWQAATLGLLFLTPVAGAWAWFHIHPREYETRLEFAAKREVPGYSFNQVSVDETVVETLATTNILNGAFVSDLGDRFIVFAGDWRDKTARQMAVIQHTPDICWVGAGWSPVELGQPDRLELNLGGSKLPFECRAFVAPNKRDVELTVWCALANGQVFEEGGRFSGATDTYENRSAGIREAGRRRALTSFLSAVRQRIPAEGTKQFVRFSAPVKGDWRITAARLRAFAEKWLDVRVSHPKAGVAR